MMIQVALTFCICCVQEMVSLQDFHCSVTEISTFLMMMKIPKLQL